MTSYYSGQSVENEYFRDRSKNPYRSTLALNEFARSHGFFSDLEPHDVVCDVACGTGSETAFLANQYSNVRFVGVDIEEEFVSAASARFSSLSNLTFSKGDLYRLDEQEEWPQVRAVWLSQTLSWLPWWHPEIECLLGPSVDRIVISTLAWNGMVESRVEHFEVNSQPTPPKQVYYNVYSVPMINDFMRTRGFRTRAAIPFTLDIDLPQGNNGGLGSYTVRLADGHRLTFSAWQALPWYFLYYSKI